MAEDKCEHPELQNGICVICRAYVPFFPSARGEKTPTEIAKTCQAFAAFKLRENLPEEDLEMWAEIKLLAESYLSERQAPSGGGKECSGCEEDLEIMTSPSDGKKYHYRDRKLAMPCPSPNSGYFEALEKVAEVAERGFNKVLPQEFGPWCIEMEAAISALRIDRGKKS